MNSQQAAGPGRGACARPSPHSRRASPAPGRRPARRRSSRATRRSPRALSAPSNFVFQDGVERLHRPGRPLLGHRRPDRHQRLHSGSLPIGTPVEVDGASKPGTLVYNSWLTMQAHGRDRSRHLRVQRPRAGQARPGRRRLGQPVGARLRRPDRARLIGRGARRHRLHLRQLLAARRRHQAEPEAGHRRPERGQRLEPHRLHASRPASPATRAAGSWTAPARRSACSARCSSPRSRPRTGSATCATSSTTCTPTARSRASAWCNGTQPFKPNLRRRDPAAAERF